MAPSELLQPSAGVPPSPSSVALALAIIKSKPYGVSARDYVLQLRAHLKQGRWPAHESEQDRYLDLVDYWKEECEVAKRECAELRSQIVKLERTNQLLDQQVERDYAAPKMAGRPKRKRTEAPTGKARKTPHSTPASVETTTENDAEVIEGNLGDDGRMLVENMWHFQKILRRRDPDPEAVCVILVGIASSLGVVFGAIARRYDRLASRTREKPTLPTLKEDRSELACTISACARAFVMLLVGLDNLHEDSPGRRLPGLVIYECVNMFQYALEAIEMAARRTAVLQLSIQPKSGSRASSSQGKTSLAAHAIAHLLVTLVGQLEHNNPVHQKLFDGFAFVLFERAGKRLYYCTFGRHQGALLEDDLTPPTNTKNATQIAQEETEALAIRYEVKELIVVLERAMGMAPTHMNHQATKTNIAQRSRPLSLRTLTASKSRLNSLTKDRLQRTLVTCMFGNKVNDDFVDVLTKPIRPAPMPTIPHMDDEEVENWYQRQVWRLVGWDILQRESDWTL